LFPLHFSLFLTKVSSTMMVRFLAPVLAAALTFALADAAAAAVPPSIQAVALEPGERIRLDGILDDDAWRRIPPMTEFVQQEPREGARPSEPTEVRIAFDRDNLYIGVVLHDSDPSGILAHQRQRNAGLGTDDRFMWILDTFLDGRTGYFFEINPAGLMGDGLIQAGGGVNKSWNGIWDVRVARGDFGWSAEIRIPFRTLNFNPELDSWGINFQRTVRRKSEEILWSGHRRNQGLFRPAHAGRLNGLEGISQGIGLEVKPYAIGSATRASTGGDWSTPADAGFDVNYSVTPGLRASLSVNTDFAEVEVDQRRVNLSRFPLRFPEQREFFLEGSGVFNFAPANGVEPYFSRRIGLVGGNPVPIRYGARLTGQAGAYDLGFVQVRTGADGEIPGEQFTVGRVVRNFLRQSSIGVIHTRRAAVSGGSADEADAHHTLGADLNLFTSRFLGDRNLRFVAFGVWHTDPLAGEPTPHSARTARGVRLSYPNDLWSGHVSYRELGEAFDPAAGFTSRRGFRRLQPSIQYAPRPEWWPAVRQLEFGLSAEYLTNMEWQPLTRNLGVGVLGVRFESGDQVSVDYDYNRERLERSFRLHPDTAIGALVPVGEYALGGWRVSGNTAGRRPVSGSLSASRGEFWSGQRTQGGGGLTLRPRPGLTVTSGYERNFVELPDARFTTEIVRLGGGWHMSPWMSLNGTMQYDNVSEIVGLYSRFRWIVRPGSDVFFVYTHNWRSFEGGLETLQQGGTTKVNYTHRF
jgi:hypothetical protein